MLVERFGGHWLRDSWASEKEGGWEKWHTDFQDGLGLGVGLKLGLLTRQESVRGVSRDYRAFTRYAIGNPYVKVNFFLILPWLKKTLFDDLAQRSFMSPLEGVRRVRLPKCYVLKGVRHIVWKRWCHQLDPAAKKCIAQPLNFYINVKLSLYSIYLTLLGWKWLKHSKSRKRCIYPPYIMVEVSFSLCNAKVGTVSKKSHE